MIPFASAIGFKILASTFTVIVSKYAELVCLKPKLFNAFANVLAEECTLSAMYLSPSLPWYTAYIPAITANKTCAVHMLDVAFSRLICCSRVCKAIRKARPPSTSLVTPIIRPGILRLYASLVAKYPACGPPYPKGIPKRCVVPTTTSTPNSAGAFNFTNDKISAATATFISLAFAFATKSV